MANRPIRWKRTNRQQGDIIRSGLVVIENIHGYQDLILKVDRSMTV